jgi:hypothetical protein
MLTRLIKLLDSFLTNRKFRVLIEGEFSVPREIVAEVPQGSVLAPVLNSLYINDASVAAGTHLARFAYGIFIYATEEHELRVLCKLQCGLIAAKSSCECWNIKIKNGKAWAIYFARRLESP